MGVVWHCVSAANHWKLAAVTCGTPARGDGRRGIHSGRVKVSIRSWVLPWPKLPTIRVQSHLLQQPQQCTANETRTHEIPPSCGLVLGNGGGGGVAVLSLAERTVWVEEGTILIPWQWRWWWWRVHLQVPSRGIVLSWLMADMDS